MTNLNAALVRAVEIATASAITTDDGSHVQPLVFFLTDGHATAGEVNSQRILDNTRRANAAGTAAVFCLAFGRQADFALLKVLSIQNNGFARKIYVAADAALQLEGFYKEVS